MADERTGLMWHRAASSVPVTLSDAQMECELSTVGGYADWRVPTFIELLSIVDHGITNPAIDLNAFPGTPLETFWTASVRGTTERAIDFTTGRADGSATTAFVRCVRDLHCTDGSGQSAPDLVDVPGALGGSACYRAFAERDWQQWTPASPRRHRLLLHRA